MEQIKNYNRAIQEYFLLLVHQTELDKFGQISFTCYNIDLHDEILKELRED